MTAKVILTFSMLFLRLTTPSFAEKPPLVPGRIALEMMAGGLGGIAVGIGVAASVDTHVQNGSGDALEGIGPALLAFMVGDVISTPIIVQAIGSVGDNSGNFAATLLGGLLGAGAGVLVIGAAHSQGSVIIALILLPLGATLGFNKTRRYDHPRIMQNALINIQNKKFSLGVPMPNMYLSAHYTHLLQHLNLLNIQF